MPDQLLDVRHLSKHFGPTTGLLKRLKGETSAPLIAVDDVSFSIGKGEIFSLVGESGSGKTTLGRALLRLIEPTSGEVHFDGTDLVALDATAMRAMRRQVQMIFQDPYSSLNPRMTARQAIGEVLRVHAVRPETQIDARIREILSLVGLPAEALDRTPRHFSGGQRQRLGIARALAMEPRFIVADEPVSAVDVSVQAQIMNLLLDLRNRLGLTLLFIAHDLSVVRYLSDRTTVLYLGRIMEVAPTEELFAAPRHPYTKALLSAILDPDTIGRRERVILKGDVPSPINPPSGCVFRERCPFALDACAREVPVLRPVTPDHIKACIRDDLE